MEEAKNSPSQETSPPQDPQPELSPNSDELKQESTEKLSRSKMAYEPDPEDLELRKKLLESKMARKKTEEDAKILMNRLALLKTEEQKVNSFLQFKLTFKIGMEKNRRNPQKSRRNYKNARAESRNAAQKRRGIFTV